MPRKSSSFAQLYDYMNKDAPVPYFVSWNLNLSDHLNRDKVVQAFYQNANLLKKRKGWNMLYHEIISFKYCPDVRIDHQMRALHDLTVKYIQLRGVNNLAYGRMHVEQGHIHFHVMISANELNSEKRHYLTTKEFNEIRINCERYLQQRYPELKQPVVYDGEKRCVLLKQRSISTQSIQQPEKVRPLEQREPINATKLVGEEELELTEAEQRKAQLEAYYQEVKQELDNPDYEI